MLNLVQHLIKSRTNETLKRVQGDRFGIFARPLNVRNNKVFLKFIFFVLQFEF